MGKEEEKVQDWEMSNIPPTSHTSELLALYSEVSIVT